MTTRRGPEWAEFKKCFDSIAGHNHRYDVFRDFVTIAAISYHNAVFRGERRDTLESEYLAIVKRYSRDDVQNFACLLANLVRIIDVEPWDALGQLYMELEVHNETAGQFFTPPEISELMARLIHGEQFKRIESEPFITLHEPACGAGGMILAFVKLVIEQKANPAHKLWVEAWDIDRTVALMCYLQLSLWNVPAKIVVGNTLTQEVREVFYTPAYALYNWKYRLLLREADALLASVRMPSACPPAEAPDTRQSPVQDANGVLQLDLPDVPPPELSPVIDLGATRTQAVQLGLF